MTFQLLCNRLPFGTSEEREYKTYLENRDAYLFSFNKEDKEEISGEAIDFINKNLRPFLPSEHEDPK